MRKKEIKALLIALLVAIITCILTYSMDKLFITVIIFVVSFFLIYAISLNVIVEKEKENKKDITENLVQAFEDAEDNRVIYIGTDKYLSIIYKKITQREGYFEAEMIDNNTIRVFIVEPDGKEQIREELSEYTFDEFTKNFKFADET